MSFQMRTSCPSNNNYYIRQVNGGWNGAIQGSPTKADANVLSNCVGYANGRFAEIMNKGYIPYQLVCNAENFIEKAKAYGLQITDYPTLGGIMVFEGLGNLAGHVMINEKLLSANSVYTSESAWGGTPFFNATRYNTNGRWGMSSNYRFIGNIVNPAIGDVHWVDPTPTGEYYTVNSSDGLWLLNGNGERIRAYVYGTKVEYLGDGYDKYGYHYYHVKVVSDGAEGYMASMYLTKDETPEPTPTPTPEEPIKVGDWVFPKELVDYYGTHLIPYRDRYQVVELVGDRAVLARDDGAIWSACNVNNLRKVD